MTLNGWLQILFFFAIILLITKPMGVFMAHVFNREKTFLDPVLRPVERLITSQKLVDRVKSDVAALRAENPGKPIPVDLVTTSGSGLDPHISPAAAEFQIPRVARERAMSETEVRDIVAAHTQGRQFGFLGEPRVNVLELNLDLDTRRPIKH